MKRTPLYSRYATLEGVKLVEFGGWELPLHYAGGITAEHEAVRTRAGLFDVSHMGECVVSGESAPAYLDYLCTNTISDMQEGQCRYTMMCYPDGTVVDDLLVYRRSPTTFFLVLNAANSEKDLRWIQTENPRSGQCPEVIDISDSTALLALQGPKALSILSTLVPDCDQIRPFTFRGMCEVGEVMCLVSRTGYTGEDGFELYCNSDEAPLLWDTLLEAGAREGLIPCGLGARDTLRFEAKLPLYGQEIGDTITPLEANLSVFVKLDKEEFCGKDALLQQKSEGVPRTLRGLEMIDRGVPRTGYPILLGDEEIGMVTSGLKSPTLGGFYALALLKREVEVHIGDRVDVMIHAKRREARLVKTPFYKRG
jgi:aminomethyltransferase